MWLIVDHKFEICNDAAVRALGYSSQSELQSTHPSQLSPEYQPDGQSSFEKAEELMGIVLSKGYKRFQWMHTRKNGENFPVEVTLTKIPFQGKDSIYCVWRDITERKKLEEEYISAKIEAEKANESKSTFLSMMSHELRTPLNAILGFSELLQTEIAGPLNKKQKSIVNSFHEGGMLLMHLVDDLLSMAQIEQNALNLNIEPITPEVVCDNSIRLVELLADNSQIKLHMTSHIKKNIKLNADKIRTEQIIVNLLTNAIKYNKANGNVWLDITMSDENYIRFTIKDDGRGISEKYHDTIFEPFNRGNKAASGIEGTGLGLSICKRLSAEMKGSCDFSSTYQKGSSFWLELPVYKG